MSPPITARCPSRWPSRLTAAAMMLCLARLVHAATPDVDVTLSRVDGHPQFDVRAQVTARTDVAGAWRVLTAYDRLASFVPNLDSSAELPLPDAAPGEHLVEQHGYGKFLFIKQPVDLVLRVREQPMSSIDMRLQSGNMRQYHARWELLGEDGPDGPQVQLRYTGLIAPDFYVPSLFGSSLMRRDLSAMLVAVVREMEKPMAKSEQQDSSPTPAPPSDTPK